MQSPPFFSMHLVCRSQTKKGETEWLLRSVITLIDDNRTVIQSANLAGILTASTIKTAAGDIEVGAGGSLTAEAIYVQDQNGNIVGVATITDGGISSFEGLNIAGVVTASSYVGSGADYQT